MCLPGIRGAEASQSLLSLQALGCLDWLPSGPVSVWGWHNYVSGYRKQRKEEGRKGGGGSSMKSIDQLTKLQPQNWDILCAFSKWWIGRKLSSHLGVSRCDNGCDESFVCAHCYTDVNIMVPVCDVDVVYGVGVITERLCVLWTLDASEFCFR